MNILNQFFFGVKPVTATEANWISQNPSQVSVTFFDEDIKKISDDSNKENCLTISDCGDTYHGLLQCMTGNQPSNYRNLYNSLLERGFKIIHWQPTTKADFEAELDSYIQISW
jgi:hypothetical protein